MNFLFTPRVASLHRDTRQLLDASEGFAAQAAALSRSIVEARDLLASGDLVGVRKTVVDAESATPTSLPTSAREAMVGAPLEMRTALASAIERESAIRDVLSRAVAFIDLDQENDARSSLRQAESLATELVTAMALAQQAGLRDVASRGEELEALARDLSRRLLFFSLFGVALLGGFAVLFQRRLYVPLRALDAGLRRASEGDLATQVETGHNDELGRLADLFNRMVAELRQREMERASERKELTRRILDAALDAVITVDPEGRITTWNRGAETIFGWPSVEVLGRPLEDLVFPPELKRRAGDGARHFVAGRADHLTEPRFEVPARRKNGEIFTAELSVVPLVEEGQPGGLAGFVRDVTEQRRAEEALRRSEELLRSVIANSPAAIWVKDLDGRYTLVNRHWLETFGLEPDDVIGSRDVDLLPRGSAESTLAHDAAVLRSKEPMQFEERMELRSGARDFLVARFPLLDVGDNPWALCGVATDVTQIVELQDQVRRSQRLEAVGRLAGGIAHDFNNLVAVILGQTQLALEDVGSAEIRGGLEEIEGAAKRAAALTSQLLAFARKQIVSTRVEDVNVLVSEAIDMVTPVLGSDLRITSDLDPDAGRIDIDPMQFSQVLLNLLVNAREAKAPQVAIATRRREVVEEDGSLELPPGAYVAVTVTDDGPGIPPAVLDRVFEPFFSTKDHGTGLGLATCHGIVKQANGAITIGNRPEGGAEVAIYLPRISGRAS